MTYTLDEAIVALANKCQRNHSCLASGIFGDQEKCKATEINGLNVIFLRQISSISCPYRLNFGTGQLCTCPVRYAIALEHGLHPE